MEETHFIPGMARSESESEALYRIRSRLPSRILLFEGAPETEWVMGEAFGLAAAHLPMVDFRAQPSPRADTAVAGVNEASLEEAARRSEVMIARSFELPALAGHADSTELQILATAYLRDTAIEADWDPDRAEMVGYPLLTGLSDPRGYLDALADAGLLERSFFDRLHQCSVCGASRLNVREECPACQAGHIEEESLIHHYRCAYQGLEREFFQDNRLICPKCRRELRHYGVDYDRPGTAYHCRACGHTSSEPAVGFICADCSAHTSSEAAPRRDWHHYRLTGEGRDALLAGRLPTRSLAESVRATVPGALARRHFDMIADFQRRIAERYERPLTAWRLTVEPATGEDGMAELGLAERERAYRLVAEVVAQAIRDCDAVTADRNEVTVLMPETDQAGAQVAMDRVQKRLEESVSNDLNVTLAFLPQAPQETAKVE